MNDLSASRWSPRMQTYYWVKTFHLVFVVAWMASVFYLPRILVNLSETAGQLPVVERLQLMGLRLYRFGHMMFGFALILGLVLWLGYKVIPDFPTMVAPGAAGWLHAKLGLVVLLLVYFSWTGRLLKGAVKGRALPSSRALRWFNELPLVLFVVVVWLVLAKPF